MKQKFEESLPDYETFKNMSCIMIAPKENSKKTPLKKTQNVKKEFYYNEPEKKQKGIILNNTLYEPIIIKNLRALYKQYSENFSSICSKVLEKKYKPINKSIYKYCTAPITNKNPDYELGCLMLNTDQNGAEFFLQFSEYIKRKGKKKKDKFDFENTFSHLYPKDFTTLDKLFPQLSIGEKEVIDDIDDQLIRIIFINDIQSINSVAFNIFIARMLEYKRLKFPKYNYVLIFDIAYDPKILYDKFNVSFLPKIQFLTITNASTNFLYHEILYNFIYGKNSGFYLPNSESMKVILESIDLHQISIDTFKHYVKFIIFQFFFMHQWNDDEFLLYMEELNENKIMNEIKKEENENKEVNKDKKSQKKKSIENDNIENVIDNKRREILEQKLIELYYSSPELKELTKKYKMLPNVISNEVEKLLNNYKEKRNNWKIFKYFYRLFEGLITEYLKNEPDLEEKIYIFLYKFLQYDYRDESDIASKNIVETISEIIKRIEKPKEAIKYYFYPKFKEIIKKIEPLLKDEDLENLKEILEDLNNYIKGFDTMEVKKEILIAETFIIWVKKLFKLNFFTKVKEAENESLKKNSTRKFINVYKKYSDYKEIIEPSLMQSFLMDLIYYATENDKSNQLFDIKENNLDFKNVLKAYFKCLMNLDTTFKLNNFFYDFLIEFKINEVNDKNKNTVEKYKEVFLILSYWFNLVGVFQRKKGKKQGFIKNYYNIVSYMEDTKNKNIGYQANK